MSEKKPKIKNAEKIIFTTGKRKRAIARARFKLGTGKVTMNQKSIETIGNELVKMKIKEPLMLMGDRAKGYDIIINATGGGIMGQIDAARQAISRGFVEIIGEEAKKTFLSYDRNLLVYDVRRTEPHKPPRSSQGPRRYKQRSKR
ncbi:MAG: 30S ribosomal protein S9 [Nanoarchaeota archaeon]|nr:30S ribosomal protein S9 [Nanoarchaeota archaeon]MBU2520144.1 30S ribosomal protein S9 [Nanoarchaeota archaeon]